MSMATYVLDHDEKSFFIKNGAVNELRYESKTGDMYINNRLNNEIKTIDYDKYLDFKFSFHDINFENEKEAKEVLEDIARDISQISKDTSYKKSWNRQIKLTGDREKDLNKVQRKEAKMAEKNIEILSKEKVFNEDENREIIKYKVEKTYNRESNLNDSIISIHTHSRQEKVDGEKSYNVKPHIHILFPKKNYFGKKLSYLRTSISNIVNERGVSSSLNTDIQRTASEYKEYKILKDRLSNFSWVVAKHKDKKYLLRQLNKEKYNNKYSVNLNNVEEKINRYLKLGGSYDFARKIKINLKNKLDRELNLDVPEDYLEAQRLLEDKNYSKIIDYIHDKIVNREKLSEKFVEFAQKVNHQDKVDIKDAQLAKYIKKAYKCRGFKQDYTFNKIINQTKLNYLASRHKKRIENIINQKKHMQQVKEFKNYLNKNKFISKESLNFLINKYDIKDFEKVTGEKYVNFVYKNNKEHIKEYLSRKKLQNIVNGLKYYNKSEFKWKLRQEIENTVKEKGLELSVKYKYKIIYELSDDLNLSKALEQKRKKYDESEVFKFLSDKQAKVIKAFEKRYNNKIESIDDLSKIDEFISYKQKVRKNKIKSLKEKLRKVDEKGKDYLYDKKLFKVLTPKDSFYKPVKKRLENIDINSLVKQKRKLESHINKIENNKVNKKSIKKDIKFTKNVLKYGYVKLYKARYREFNKSKNWTYKNIELLHKYNKRAERFVDINEYKKYFKKVQKEHSKLKQKNFQTYKKYKDLKNQQELYYREKRQIEINNLRNKLKEPTQKLNDFKKQISQLNKLINQVENNRIREKNKDKIEIKLKEKSRTKKENIKDKNKEPERSR